MPKLRPYQKEDVLKLSQLKCSACLNEQRTGKTPTALAIAKVQRHKKILIVCPGVALYNWKEQFETWVGRPCIVLDGTPKQREQKLQQWTDGLCITFDTLKLITRIDKTTNKAKKMGELTNILKHNIDMVIVDEFHRARNRKTLVAKALFKLITKVPCRLALTGTPAYAKNEDIWTLLHFLYPNHFPSYYDFINEYFEISMKWTPNGNAQVIGNMFPHKQTKLQSFLLKVATQRKQHDPDVMPWLPEKPTPIPVRLPPSDSQTKYLDTLMKYFEAGHVICKLPIDRLIRYRQICQDPHLLDLKGTSAKTEWLTHYYSDYPETPTIIFSGFTSYLELLAKNCPKKCALITGETSAKNRKEIERNKKSKIILELFIFK